MLRCAKLGLHYFAMIAVAGLGCGKSVPVGYVNGTVEFDGKPAPVDHVVFFQQPSKGIIAGGMIGENGEYVLKYRGAEGIPPGDYVVFVGPPASNMTEQEFAALKRKVDAEYRARGQKPPPSPDWVMPEKYYLASTSPLRESVTTGENVINIKLEK
ncbi:MAG: hypothetical protein ACR2NM_03260 [Bythopirellula sp.]